MNKVGELKDNEKEQNTGKVNDQGNSSSSDPLLLIPC
jgi:hypothetical protein